MRELLARLYDEPPASSRRLRPVRAELTGDRLGLMSAARRDVVAGVDRVGHRAASISVTLPLAQARSINVEGTRQVLELAREVEGLQRLMHASTAYVAGRAEGRFTETHPFYGQRFRNTYEQTKCEAERLVAAATGLPSVVVRPSIVTGESDSGCTSAFNVV